MDWKTSGSEPPHGWQGERGQFSNGKTGHGMWRRNATIKSWIFRFFNGDLMVINPLVMEYKWLVGDLEHGCYFSIYWECHHPNWLIFFRGVGLSHQPEIKREQEPPSFGRTVWCKGISNVPVVKRCSLEAVCLVQILEALWHCCGLYPFGGFKGSGPNHQG